VLLGTGLEAAILLGEVPTGIVADAYSRRFSIVIGFLVTAVGWLVMASRAEFGFILIGQVAWGIGSTFGSGAREAWLADEVGERAAAPLYVRERQFWLIGHMIGIPRRSAQRSTIATAPSTNAAITRPASNRATGRAHRRSGGSQPA
jgi:DHA3 family tetracycline resistance protein-like MFS transporter